MDVIIKYFICFLFLFAACTHPESDKYARNKGISVENSPNELSNEIETPSETLKMEVENGVRYVVVELNDIPLRFIFDTGASSISISPSEAITMIRNGTITEEDIIGTQDFQDATGNVSEGVRINIRSLKIGSLELNDVEAIVTKNINAPLLLGQSVFERFGKITIDNQLGEIRFY